VTYAQRAAPAPRPVRLRRGTAIQRLSRLPPLNALRTFHAVVRHGSLRAAADELLVTPQAVGQQVRLLEDALGIALVRRDGRAIRLTDAALTLSHYVSAGFAEFEEGLRRISGVGNRPRINLNVSPYFGIRHLMPRLQAFRQAVPEAEIGLTTMIDRIDLERDKIDLAVQWAHGVDAAPPGPLLLRDPKIICCRPDFAQRLRRPEDLLSFTLLQPARSAQLWPDILGHLGLPRDAADRSLTFDDAATMRRATEQGLGIGLISALDADEDLAAGRLAAPFGRDALTTLPDAMVPGFYLLSTKARLRAGPVAALYRWLLAQDWECSPA
jgi:LysR family transcriptional regulator, glycine cleavage system transcriptional activator